jgi:hypothetical protein
LLKLAIALIGLSPRTRKEAFARITVLELLQLFLFFRPIGQLGDLVGSEKFR